MASQPGKQITAIHINEGNEIWSVKNITLETFFLKNHSQNMVEKLFPDPFLNNQN